MSDDGWPSDEAEEPDQFNAHPGAVDEGPAQSEVSWLVPGIIAADDGMADEWLDD